MEDSFRFYEQDFSTSSEALSTRLITLFERGPTPENRLAAAFLLPHLDMLPQALSKKLPTLAAQSFEKEAAKLFYLLKHQLVSERFEIEALDAARAYWESPSPDGSEIIDQLCLSYVTIHYAGVIPPNTRVFVETLMRKFESIGRLYTQYSPDFRSFLGECDRLELYALLSLVLCSLYQTEHKAEHLNCMLKLNDMLVDCLPHIKDAVTHALSLLALLWGEKQVESFYDHHHFSLPAHR